MEYLKSQRKTSKVGTHKIRVNYKYFRRLLQPREKSKKYLKIEARVERIILELFYEKEFEEHDSVNYKQN